MNVRDRRRQAAARYRPEDIELLLVAEAPPRDADRYFYFEDVPAHDHLFRAVARVLLGEEPSRGDKARQLRALQARGVFLIDLCEEPVDDRTQLSAHVPSLIRRAGALDPRRIVLIKATVYDHAYLPLRDADLPVIDERIPFPSHGHQHRFAAAFARAVAASGIGPKRGLSRAINSRPADSI